MLALLKLTAPIPARAPQVPPTPPAPQGDMDSVGISQDDLYLAVTSCELQSDMSDGA